MDTFFTAARKAMVESQIRPNKVIDEAVIAAFQSVPREQFVPKQMREIAYVDEDIAVSNGRYLVEAMVLARMVQALELQNKENMLLVGAGTGYSAAIFSHLVSSVIAIESRAPLVQKAEDNLAELQIDNVAVIKGRLADGYAGEAPFDVIFIDGGVAEEPSELLTQLGPNGVLASIWRPDERSAGEASLWHRAGDQFVRRGLFNAQVPVLEEFKAKPAFAF